MTRRAFEQAQRLEGEQLGVAGADAETEQTASHHSTSEARALTAATAMANRKLAGDMVMSSLLGYGLTARLIAETWEGAIA